jgi:hypothetical protein
MKFRYYHRAYISNGAKLNRVVVGATKWPGGHELSEKDGMNHLMWSGLSYWASGGLQAGVTGGRAGGRACPLRRVQTGCVGHILLIFFKNTLNILEYTRIYSIISLSGGHRGLSSEAGGRTHRQPCMWSCFFIQQRFLCFIFALLSQSLDNHFLAPCSTHMDESVHSICFHILRVQETNRITSWRVYYNDNAFFKSNL